MQQACLCHVTGGPSRSDSSDRISTYVRDGCNYFLGDEPRRLEVRFGLRAAEKPIPQALECKSVQPTHLLCGGLPEQLRPAAPHALPPGGARARLRSRFVQADEMYV